jgi:hypothetical protein
MEDRNANYHGKSIKRPIRGLTPFPEDIFIPAQASLENYLLSLISIDLGLLRNDLQGTTVHILNPVEPYEGFIGEETAEFHNAFCGENWLTLELTKDNKYQFLGDEGYFLSAPVHNHKDKIDELLLEHIKEVKDTYRKVKSGYKSKGQLLPWQADNPQDFIDRLGGEIHYGNWTDSALPPPAFDMLFHETAGENLPNDGISISYKGNHFFLVAEVAGYHYCGHGADAILTFYEPESRTGGKRATYPQGKAIFLK